MTDKFGRVLKGISLKQLLERRQPHGGLFIVTVGNGQLCQQEFGRKFRIRLLAAFEDPLPQVLSFVCPPCPTHEKPPDAARLEVLCRPCPRALRNERTGIEKDLSLPALRQDDLHESLVHRFGRKLLLLPKLVECVEALFDVFDDLLVLSVLCRRGRSGRRQPARLNRKRLQGRSSRQRSADGPQRQLVHVMFCRQPRHFECLFASLNGGGRCT